MTKVGSVVWVRPGLGDHEEPATVLQVKCHYDDPYNNNDDGEDDDDDDGSKQQNEHGIKIRYNVSLVETIVHQSRIRDLLNDNDNDDNNYDDGNAFKRRRSRRHSTTRTNSSTINTSTNNDSLQSSKRDSGKNDKEIKPLDAGNTKKKIKKTTKRSQNIQEEKKMEMEIDHDNGVKDGDDESMEKNQDSTNYIPKKNKTESRKRRSTSSTATTTKNSTNRKDAKEHNDESVLIKATSPSPSSPPPKKKVKVKATTNNSKKDPIANDKNKESSSKTKASATTKRTTKKTKNDDTNNEKIKKGKKASSSSLSTSSPYFDNEEDDDDNDDDEIVSTLKTKKSKLPTTKATKKTESKAKSKSTTKTTSSSSKKAKAGKPDGHGNLTNNKNSIYIIEYAKTGRSTCKRCDQRIKKDEIRVGHRPLFRGKPGFRIYKHLHCIVFSSDVCSVVDVDGYEDLQDDDVGKLEKRIKESQIEIKEENEELDPDELVQKGFEGEVRDRPEGLKATLLPFQKEGVSWMYCQEVNVPEIRGGILADEMGMGKTLQTITTLLDNRPKLQHSLPGTKHPPSYTEEMIFKLNNEEQLWEGALKEWKHEMKMNDVPASVLPKTKKSGVGGGGGARAGTLVICPVIALTQWKSEIEKFCEENALTVCIYHGPDRAKLITRDILRKFDVVLTTYQVIEQDFRKMVSPNKVKCPNCGKKFKVDKLRVHLKYFCGEGAQRTEAQARTRRNSERDEGGGNRRGRGVSIRGRNSKSGSDERKMTKVSVANKKTKTITKKVFKVKGDADYDSESDLSAADNVPAMTKRSPRSAAIQAKKRVSASARSERKTKKYIDSTDDEDDEDYDNGGDNTVEEQDDDDDAEDVESSSEDEAVKRARERQAKALKRAKGKGKQFEKEAQKKKFSKDGEKKGSKKNTSKKSKKSNTNKKAKKGKKPDDEDSESEFDSDDDDDDLGIDMDELIAEAMAGAQMSVLHSFCWWRVVLDEAHFIKSRSSQTSASAFALTGVHRWCLSGTPLQNRVGEFYSLVRFLRLDPMAHYMCRADGCNCKQVHYRMMNGRCKDCGHSSIQHYSHFNRQILNPIQRDGYTNDGRRAMFTLKNEVLDKCLLRRTKETRAEDMNLPPRIVTIKSIKLHPIEEDFYNAVFTKTSSSFNDYVAEGTLLNNYAHIFDLLMRMRQSVCHPYLVVHSKRDSAARRSSSTPQISNGTAECMLCDEPITERVVSTCCQTAFCKSCVIEYMETSAGVNENGAAQTPCPNCRNPFSIDLTQVQNIDEDPKLSKSDQKISKVGLPSLRDLPHVTTGSILRRIDLTKFATSSKIEALTMELVNMRKTSPGSKAIVFSQFVNMLDLIRWRLHSDPCLSEMGLGVRALQGSMDVKARDAALKDFREDPSVRVLLMSLKAGGVALNLTIANHIYLMDPWWNPAAEMQAIDRTHRLGQYRPIRAVRFIAANTVEERILQLQEKKRLVFDGTVGRDAGSLKMLTVDDMKSLFG